MLCPRIPGPLFHEMAMTRNSGAENTQNGYAPEIARWQHKRKKIIKIVINITTTTRNANPNPKPNPNTKS